MKFEFKDITVVIAQWMQTRMTMGAIKNIRKHYPDIPLIVVDDGTDDPRGQAAFNQAYSRPAYSAKERLDPDMTELDLAHQMGLIQLIKVGKHVGHGSALDYAVEQVDTPLMLTMDNDMRIVEGGLVEEYLEKMNEDPDNIYAVGTTYTERDTGEWIDPWFSLYQLAPIKELHLTFSNFIFPVKDKVYSLDDLELNLKKHTFHIGTGAFLHAMLTFDTLHRPKIWRAVHYPEPEKIKQLWHLKKFPEDGPGEERYDKWKELFDG